MICPACATEQEFVDGRCVACGGAAPAPSLPSVACPKCGARVEKGEKFCAACGAKFLSRADKMREMHQKRQRQENLGNVNRGRKIMLLVAVLAFLGTALTYFLGRNQIEANIKMGDGLSPEERDDLAKEVRGMSWQEMIEEDRGRLTIESAVSAAVGLIFIGFWWWAKSNPFGAALSALLLYCTVQLVTLVVNFRSMINIFIVLKVFIVISLSSAVSAGYLERQRRRAA